MSEFKTTIKGEIYQVYYDIEGFPSCCGMHILHNMGFSIDLGRAPEAIQKAVLRRFSKYIIRKSDISKIIIADAIGGENEKNAPSFWKMAQVDDRWKPIGRITFNHNSGNRVRLWECNFNKRKSK